MRSVVLIVFLCLTAADSLIADDEFAPAVRIHASGAPIDIKGFRGAAPAVGDIDGDGLQDLLVGQHEQGRLRIYRNLGTNQEPRFGDFDWFRANGEIAELPGGGLFRPQLVDLNGDGNLDIVSPSESDMIFWYPRTATGEFAKAEIVRLANGMPLTLGSHVACHVVDWEGDGDLDIVVAARPAPALKEIHVWIVRSEGVAPEISLAPPQPLMEDKSVLKITSSEANPYVLDWNGDGKQDLLLGGGTGSVFLYENVGEAREPQFAQFQLLLGSPPHGRAPENNAAVNRGTGGCICVTDWNSDGRPDLLIGDSQDEFIRPDVTVSVEKLQKLKEEAAHVLTEYRRLRRIDNRITEKTQGKGQEFVRQSRAKYAKRIEELRDEMARVQSAMKPRREIHGYVWFLQHLAPAR